MDGINWVGTSALSDGDNEFFIGVLTIVECAVTRTLVARIGESYRTDFVSLGSTETDESTCTRGGLLNSSVFECAEILPAVVVKSVSVSERITSSCERRCSASLRDLHSASSSS